jgi:4-amino-4-deoxy-L-arabinose transferase-like glycosyltransferase
MSTESMPTRVIWWGVGVAIGGALLIIAVPGALNAWWAPNTEQWQSAFVVVAIIQEIARFTLPPLGAALIAAGIVMRYIDRRLTGERIADRPRRWRWPAEASEEDRR